MSGAILIEAECLGAAVSFGLPEQAQRPLKYRNSPRRAATQIAPCRS